MTLILFFLHAAVLLSASGPGENVSGTEGMEISVWTELHHSVAATAASLDEIPLYQELERRTGIKVNWIHPGQGQQYEQFNLLVASEDYPDIIFWDWINRYPGGPEKAIEDNVIVRLNELIADHAPNLRRRYHRNPDWEKAVKTDQGTMYCFPFIRGDDSLMVYFGPILRKDFLDELALKVPETIDEWYVTLKALQEKVEHPLTFTAFDKGGRDIKNGSCFASAFGIQLDKEWYQIDGRAKWGWYEPGLEFFLALFRQWYEEGLIDPEFFINDMKTFEAKILNDRAAAFVGYGGSNMGKFLDAMESAARPFDLVGAKYPVLKKGDVAFAGQIALAFSGLGSAITTQARDPVVCTKWSDYAYGEEGHVLFNFGIEGESFRWVNGFPQFTDVIFNNPDSLGIAQALARFVCSSYNGPMIQDQRYIVQYYRREEQKDAWEKWQQTQAADHRMPGVTPTPEESAEMAAIMTEIETYADEMFVRFVTGQEPLTNFGRYREQLRKLGVESAIEIMQAALDRYNARLNQ